MPGQTCIFIGRSGSGKGTQSKLLMAELARLEPGRKTIYAETGSLFRQFVTTAGPTQDLTRQTLGQGGRLPDALAIWIWQNLLINELRDEDNLIFDGAPRSILEAQVLGTALRFYGRIKPAVLFLNTGRDWATTRLKERGREDDHDEKIANRLSWFDKDVAPAVTYFREQPDYLFLEINGEQAIEKVSRDIWRGLGLVHD